MDADYPFGTYTYDTSGGTVGAATTSFDYTSDAYPEAQPFLTGTDYDALQGVNAHAPITVNFSPFASNALAAFQFEFFTVFDNTLGSFVYDAGFLPFNTPGVTLAADTLLPGHFYSYELIDSNRFLASSPGAAFNAQLGFELRTQGTFTTSAVPEPGALAMLSGMGVFVGLVVRRRIRK
jgi:hypothetical protein